MSSVFPAKQHFKALRRFAHALVMDEVLLCDAYLGEKASKFPAEEKPSAFFGQERLGDGRSSLSMADFGQILDQEPTLERLNRFLAHHSAPIIKLEESALFALATPIADTMLRFALLDEEPTGANVRASAKSAAHNDNPPLSLYRALIDMNRARAAFKPHYDCANYEFIRVENSSAGQSILGLYALLPLEQREVYALCVLEDLAYPQVAECLGISLSVVITRLMAARETITKNATCPTLAAKQHGPKASPQKPLYPAFAQNPAGNGGNKPPANLPATPVSLHQASAAMQFQPMRPRRADITKNSFGARPRPGEYEIKSMDARFKPTAVPHLRIVI